MVSITAPKKKLISFFPLPWQRLTSLIYRKLLFRCAGRMNVNAPILPRPIVSVPSFPFSIFVANFERSLDTPAPPGKHEIAKAVEMKL
jgi:hypothetical protein